MGKDKKLYIFFSKGLLRGLHRIRSTISINGSVLSIFDLKGNFVTEINREGIVKAARFAGTFDIKTKDGKEIYLQPNPTNALTGIGPTRAPNGEIYWIRGGFAMIRESTNSEEYKVLDNFLKPLGQKYILDAKAPVPNWLWLFLVVIFGLPILIVLISGLLVR